MPLYAGDADGIPCCDDAEVCQKLSRAVQKQSPEGKTRRFVWGQLRNIAQLYESRAQRQRLEAAAQRAGSTLQQSNGHDSVPSEPISFLKCRWQFQLFRFIHSDASTR